MPTPPITGLRYLVAAGTMLCVALLPHRARAGLGDPETAVAADAQKLDGTIKSTDRGSYRVHEIQLPSGTVLREFAGADGTVFAVAWKGPRIPNLRQALGQYYDVLKSAPQSNQLGRSHMEFRQDNFVVQSSGHMRAFRGRAYLPQSVPVGTSLDEIH